MRRVLRCDDLNPGCTFEAWGYTDEDVLHKVREHAKTVHKMNKISLDVLDKARNAIHDVGRAQAHKAGK